MRSHLQYCQGTYKLYALDGLLAYTRNCCGSLLPIPEAGFAAAMSPQGLHRSESPLFSFEQPLCVPRCRMGI